MASTRLLLASTTGLLTLSSLGLMLAGIVRQKLAVVIYGPDVLGVLGQATLLASTAAIVVSAGAVLGGRVVMSDGRLPLEVRIAAGSWLVRRTFLLAAVLVPLLILAGPLLSTFFTGSPQWAAAFQFAAAGVAFSIVLNIAIVVTQLFSSRRRMLVVVLVTSLAMLVSNVVFVIPGNLTLLFATSLITPSAALLAMLLANPEVRHLVRATPWLDGTQAKRTLKVAASSTAVGLTAALVQSALSARLAHAVDLYAVGLLQPVLVVAQLLAVVTASATNSLSAHHNAVQSSDSPVRSSGPWRDAIQISSAICVVSVIVLPLVPVGLRLIYSADLLPAVPAVSLQVMSEGLTALVWLGASMLVPSGRFRLWLAVSLLALGVKFAVGWALMPMIGVIAFPIATLLQMVLTVLLYLVILRPCLGRSSVLFLTLMTVAVASACFAWLGYPRFALAPYLLSLSVSVVLALLIGNRARRTVQTGSPLTD